MEYPGWLDEGKKDETTAPVVMIMRAMYRVNGGQNVFAQRCRDADSNLKKNQCIQDTADYVGSQDGPIWQQKWPYPVHIFGTPKPPDPDPDPVTDDGNGNGDPVDEHNAPNEPGQS